MEMASKGTSQDTERKGEEITMYEIKKKRLTKYW
jgi:hypothetical protein